MDNIREKYWGNNAGIPELKTCSLELTKASLHWLDSVWIHLNNSEIFFLLQHGYSSSVEQCPPHFAHPNFKDIFAYGRRIIFRFEVFTWCQSISSDYVYPNFWLSYITWKVNESYPVYTLETITMPTSAKTLPRPSSFREKPHVGLLQWCFRVMFKNNSHSYTGTLLQYPQVIFLFPLLHSWFHEEILFPEVELQHSFLSLQSSLEVLC